MLFPWKIKRNESLESNEKKSFYLQKKVVFKVLGILRDEDKSFWDGSQFTNQFSLLSCNQNTLKDSYKEGGLIWAHDYGAQAVVACTGDRSMDVIQAGVCDGGGSSLIAWWMGREEVDAFLPSETSSMTFRGTLPFQCPTSSSQASSNIL